jgi:hypothetical protein
MNGANYLEKNLKTRDKSVLCTECASIFSVTFLQKISTFHILEVTVENSTETHAEVFMYKCPFVASPLNWDWKVSELEEIHNTKCHDNKLNGSGVFTCGRTHITN